MSSWNNFSIDKNSVEETAKCKILSYSRMQQQNRIVATNADKNGFISSVKLMLGASGKNVPPVKKLVILVENQ